MARRTKRADGLMQKKFYIKIKGVNKQFVVYGHTEKELSEKEQAKREEIKKGIDRQENPSVCEYYDRWSAGRRETVSEATIRTQEKIFCIMKDIKISNLANIPF